jgi:hypothetical protein
LPLAPLAPSPSRRIAYPGLVPGGVGDEVTVPAILGKGYRQIRVPALSFPILSNFNTLRVEILSPSISPSIKQSGLLPVIPISGQIYEL